MSRNNLTSNRRSFGRNPKNFLDMVTEAPIDILINDGVNPEYTLTVRPNNTTNLVESSDAPASVTVTGIRRTGGDSINPEP